MKIEMSKTLTKQIKNRIEGFDFEVGVLEDKPHKEPVASGLFEVPNLKSYAGGPIRPTSRIAGPLSIGEVLIENMRRLNIDLLRKPFEDPKTEIMRFTREFLRYACTKRGSLKRVENLLQAVVRNPILRQAYGPNKGSTADNKGFDRHLFDTGQMFKAIKARVTRV